MDASRAVSSNRFRFVALATLAVCAGVACGGSSRPAKVDGGAADAAPPQSQGVLPLSADDVSLLAIGTVELKDEEQRRLAQLEHEIELLINPTEQDHKELVETIKQIPWRLERGTAELGELNPLMDRATALGQKIYKTEWDQIKNDLRNREPFSSIRMMMTVATTGADTILASNAARERLGKRDAAALSDRQK